MFCTVTKLVVLIITDLYVSSAEIAGDLVVQLPEGKIRGHILKSQNGAEYYAFQEIPFAAPPVGSNRFKEPKHHTGWDGVLNTTKNTKICLQGDFNVTSLSNDDLLQTEDCLYLNVYIPSKPGGDENDLPVMVWIHGGGFVRGSSAMYGVKYLMDYGVIIVTTNYRIGALGFLTTMDGVIPGNLGLKDQHFALKWVNSNIRLFGGDPDKVTIIGESAGAFSVSYQMLGRHSKGLFRGVVIESGSSICPSGTTTNTARHYAFELGKILDSNFTSQNSKDLLTLLGKFTGKDIASAANNVTNIENRIGFIRDEVWSPVIENKSDKNAFITAPMHECFMRGNFTTVPTLIGFNSEEALYYITDVSKLPGDANRTDQNSSSLINVKFNVADVNKTIAGTELKKVYTNTTFSDDLGAYVRFSSDAHYTTCTIRQAALSSNHVPVYLYQFSYPGDWTHPSATRTRISGAELVGHSEELYYLFDLGLGKNISDYPASDQLTQKRMLKLWTNFIKYQNPTPEEDEIFGNVTWPTLEENKMQYLNINETLQVRLNPRYYEAVSAVLNKYLQPPYVVY